MYANKSYLIDVEPQDFIDSLHIDSIHIQNPGKYTVSRGAGRKLFKGTKHP